MAGRHIRPGLGRFFPTPRLAAIVARLVALHLLNHAGMRYRRCAVIHPDLIAVGVIAMMMRVESESDRLRRDRPNLRQNDFGAGREIGVNNQNMVFENDPAVVAVALVVLIALMK